MEELIQQLNSDIQKAIEQKTAVAEAENAIRQAEHHKETVEQELMANIQSVEKTFQQLFSTLQP